MSDNVIKLPQRTTEDDIGDLYNALGGAVERYEGKMNLATVIGTINVFVHDLIEYNQT